MVIASRPHADPHDAIEVELSPTWDVQGLTGFQILASGEASFSADLPTELSRTDLGAKLSIKVLGRDFLFALHQTFTKWKDARKLVSADRLRFFKPAPTGGKSSSPNPRVAKEDTLAALQKSPLAFRLELVRQGDDMHLALTAVLGISALLNNGTHGFDPDDASLVSKLPVVTIDGAVVVLYPSGINSTAAARDDALRELFNEYLPEHVALTSSPGRTQRSRQARDDFQLLRDKH